MQVIGTEEKMVAEIVELDNLDGKTKEERVEPLAWMLVDYNKNNSSLRVR